MNFRPTVRSRRKFEYFSACIDTKSLAPVTMDPDGYSAAECFHARETYGVTPPCREPELLQRAINGKEWHGLTVTMVAEDYVDRLVFANDIRSGYPDWVQRDILGRAAQIAQARLGFVPTFVSTGEDFTTLDA